jgi:hypothetical protein
MAHIKIHVIYEAEEEIDKIISISKSIIDADIDKDLASNQIQKILQNAFDDGREFQKEYKGF